MHATTRTGNSLSRNSSRRPIGARAVRPRHVGAAVGSLALATLCFACPSPHPGHPDPAGCHQFSNAPIEVTIGNADWEGDVCCKGNRRGLVVRDNVANPDVLRCNT